MEIYKIEYLCGMKPCIGYAMAESENHAIQVACNNLDSGCCKALRAKQIHEHEMEYGKIKFNFR